MKQSSVRVGAVLVACLAAALVQTSLAATSHTVGGSSGWTIPSSSSLYTTWASQQTFKVGDSLVFNFATGAHTVAEVSKSAYDACTTTNSISTFTSGPATVKIASAGSHYYICTIPGHCTAGQKVSITATGSSSAAPTSSPKSSPAPTAAAPTPSPTSSPAPTTATPTSSPTPAAATPTSTPTSSPSPATTTAPTPSSSTATPPSGAGSPGSSTVPSVAGSPSGGTTAPPPSSATVAGAGLVLPFIMIAAAFLV